MTNLPVIVGVDGSESANEALLWAAREAAAHSAPLHIVSACVDPIGYGSRVPLPAFDFDPLRDHARKILAHAKTAAHEHAGLDATTILTEGQPAAALIDLSKDARLVVVGSRGLGAFRRNLMGSVSTAVARHAHCPVAVIHERDPEKQDEVRHAVVVGVDGTRNSERAIEIAFDEASHRDLELIAVHAWLDTSDFDFPTDWAATADTAELVLAESLAGWQEKYPEVAVQRIVVKDRSVRHLAEEADNAELLVVGSHGRGGFSGLLLGSTSQALLHTVTCPLIIVRGPVD